MSRPRDLTAATALLAVGAVGCVLGVLMPLSPASPVLLDAVLAVVGAGTAALTWWAPRRWRSVMPHVACAVTVAAASLLVVASATTGGEVATAFTYVWVGLYAACFFRRSVARAWVGVSLASFAGALVVHPFLGAPQTFLLLALTTVIASEVLGRLVAQLQHQVSTDPLTGVLNRHGLSAHTALAFARARRTGTSVAVAVLDLDGFKGVNDTRGHQAGDEMLAGFARDLRSELRREDVLARVGGDEFVVLLHDADSRHLDVLARRLRRRSPVAWTYGATATDGSEVLEDVLARADEVLYAHKRMRLPEQRPSLTR